MDTGLGQPLVAVRVKDGIFVGNVTAAHDEDFLVMNKVTHIVNCAGGEVKDLFEEIGIEYLTFPWKDSSASINTTQMFDAQDRNIEQVVRFVDQGLEGGNCVLIHSYFGVSRSCALLAAYLMMKYGWKLDNTLQFISLAHQDMNIKPHFLRQLRAFAKRHEVNVDVFSKCVDTSEFSLDNDQWMLRNTFLNGLTADVQQRNELFKEAVSEVAICDPNFKSSAKRRRRITFFDTRQGTAVASSVTQPLATRIHHVDPNVKDSIRPSALARRGQPNSHVLEAPSTLNPKGRQILPVKTDPQPQSFHGGNFSEPPPEPEEAPRTPTAPPQLTAMPQPASHVPQKTSIRSPFALSTAAGGAPRNGSPLPMQRAGRREEARTIPVPSIHSALQSQRANSPRPNPVRAESPVKRPIQRTDSPKPVERGGSGLREPLSARIPFPTAANTVPNAHSTIVTNSALRATATIRPYAASPMASSSLAPAPRAGSPMVRRASSPLSRDPPQQPLRGSPMRTSSPMTRERQASSLADQYLGNSGNGGGSARPRETTASLLRRQQNLTAHRQ